MYERRGEKIDFEKKFAKDKYLQFVFKGTRDNQLFLSNSVSQKVDCFKAVYDWFDNRLQLVAHDSRFGRVAHSFPGGMPNFKVMEETLARMDLGITDIQFEAVKAEDLDVSSKQLSDIDEHLAEGGYSLLTMAKDPIIFSRLNGELIATKITTSHSGKAGDKIMFGFEKESDGSKNVIDLLPALLDLFSGKSRRVYVIDEFDRSLHPLLNRKLLERYLSTCTHDTRAQLILASHDVVLMDQELLRRDEMWQTERDAFGASTLTSFIEFKDVLADKDLQISYLMGRLGGIPRL